MSDRNFTERRWSGFFDAAETESNFMLLETRMDDLKAQVDLNNEQTAEILEIVQMAKGFFKVLGHIGKFIKWALAIGASVVAIAAAWKSGHFFPPPP